MAYCNFFIIFIMTTISKLKLLEQSLITPVPEEESTRIPTICQEQFIGRIRSQSISNSEEFNFNGKGNKKKSVSYFLRKKIMEREKKVKEGFFAT